MQAFRRHSAAFIALRIVWAHLTRPIQWSQNKLQSKNKQQNILECSTSMQFKENGHGHYSIDLNLHKLNIVQTIMCTEHFGGFK